MTGTYFLIDALTLFPVLLASFHPRIRFDRFWRSYLPAMAGAVAVFLLWDVYFTWLGVWGFNKRYVAGWYIGNLPVEEVLFFLCIPYACVFTTYCFSLTRLPSPGPRAQRAITIILIFALWLAGMWNIGRRYTAVTLLSLAILLMYCEFIGKTIWLGRFYLTWLILLAPLILVDGILTGTGLQQPIVWYNEADIIGIRVLTIPIEDLFYGMELILLNILLMRHRWTTF